MNIKSINHPKIIDREYFSFAIIKINSGKNKINKIQNKISFHVIIIIFNSFRNKGLILFISNREIKIQAKKKWSANFKI